MADSGLAQWNKLLMAVHFNKHYSIIIVLLISKEAHFIKLLSTKLPGSQTSQYCAHTGYYGYRRPPQRVQSSPPIPPLR